MKKVYFHALPVVDTSARYVVCYPGYVPAVISVPHAITLIRTTESFLDMLKNEVKKAYQPAHGREIELVDVTDQYYALMTNGRV